MMVLKENSYQDIIVKSTVLYTIIGFIIAVVLMLLAILIIRTMRKNKDKLFPILLIVTCIALIGCCVFIGITIYRGIHDVTNKSYVVYEGKFQSGSGKYIITLDNGTKLVDQSSMFRGTYEGIIIYGEKTKLPVYCEARKISDDYNSSWGPLDKLVRSIESFINGDTA